MPSVTPARSGLGSVKAGDRPGEEGELPAMMIDAAAAPTCRRSSRCRRAGRWRAGRRKARPAAAPISATAHIATSIGSNGATVTAIVSAVLPPKKGVNSSFSPAIGRSTSRDQWMLEPARRCCWRSYQPWPVEQAADLHHPHIVVGVAEREALDPRPAVEDQPGREAEPEQRAPPAPMPVHELEGRPASTGIDVSFLSNPSDGH